MIVRLSLSLSLHHRRGVAKLAFAERVAADLRGFKRRVARKGLEGGREGDGGRKEAGAGGRGR